ncbi:MAG: putative toxin-antitoxin system toxin component, PIN family [Moorellales bacterium]
MDTNVCISAILFGGKPERIINMARSGEIELLISPDILAEVARVLRGQKIKNRSAATVLPALFPGHLTAGSCPGWTRLARVCTFLGYGHAE